MTRVTLAILAGLVAASHAFNHDHRARQRREAASPLTVTLESIGNTIISATVTNDGDHAYNLYLKNTLLDNKPVDKVVATVDDNKVPSNGLRIIYSQHKLSATHFLALGPGQAHQVEFDIAETHRLHESPHGLHKVSAEGSFLYAELNSTKAMGRIPYASNELELHIDQNQAAVTYYEANPDDRSRELRKRSIIDKNHCSSGQAYQIAQAQRYVVNMAQRAGNAAATGSPRQLFLAYWRSTSFVDEISQCFHGIANEAGGVGGDKITIACRDTGPGDSCAAGPGEDEHLAIAREYDNLIVLCPGFWSAPITVNNCSPEEDSQASTLLHELTHFKNVCGHVCEDLAYHRASSKGLPAVDAVDNADTYALFAEDYVNNCSG